MVFLFTFFSVFTYFIWRTALDNMIRKETPSNNQEISNTIRKGKPTSNRKVRHLILRYLNCRKFNNNKTNNTGKRKMGKNNKLLQQIKQLTSTSIPSSPTLINFLLGVLIDGRKFTCKKYNLLKRKVWHFFFGIFALHFCLIKLYKLKPKLYARFLLILT